MSEAGEGDSRKLRILLIAYEFPPSPSPQSLRWAYLSNRLAAMGHEMHVLAPDIGGSMEGLPDPGPGVQIHRTRPGPVRGLLGWLARRRPVATDRFAGPVPPVIPANAGSHGPTISPGEPPPPTTEPSRLNWKGRLLERFQKGVSWFLFPDLRSEWKRPAWRALPDLLHRIRPDVVISSHEPATTLELGLEAKRKGFRWVADLGDPVLAPYTPRRWQRRAWQLEHRVLREADDVLITAARASDLLRQRHGTTTPITLVTQGFDEQLPPVATRPASGSGPLDMLYAGTFYSFRDPRALVDAVVSVPGVRLNIASGSLPQWLHDAEAAHPAGIRLLGRVPHRDLLALQRRMDVLVNLANADPSQVPGKFYEYLGAGRPILHLLANGHCDAAGAMLQELRRGWICSSDPGAIRQVLEHIAAAYLEGSLGAGLDLAVPPVAHCSWSASALRVENVLVGGHRA